jgi:predicted HicB family RNase H-like nuclease
MHSVYNVYMKETRIRLEDSDHERLRVAAALAGLSMAEFVKQATLSAVKEQEAKAGQR